MTENSTQNANPVDNVKEVLAVVSSEKGWAIGCYIPIFNVVVCVLASIKMVGSKFCLFHARQGLVLFALWFFTIVVALFSPEISLMLWGAVLLLHGAGMFIAYGMKTTEIPILGQLAMRIPETYLFGLLTGKKLDKPIVPSVQNQPPVQNDQNSTKNP